MATFKIETTKKIEGLDFDVAIMLLNIAVLVAPEDTGNLKSSIILKRQTRKTILIAYDDIMARYTDYLEEGIGFIKKHKDFIKKDTMNFMTTALIGWLMSGTIPPQFLDRPEVKLKKSSHGAIGYEKKILRALNLATNRINATERMRISRLMSDKGVLEKGFKPRVFDNQNKTRFGMGKINRLR